MTKRILINATQQEETRVALVDGQWLYDLEIENTSRKQKKGDVYEAVVKRLEPGLEAAFIDFGSERQGFLPYREVAPEYYPNGKKTQNRPHNKNVLKVGQTLLVQMVKEERGNKGAAFTTYISLAGCYLVLMPNNPRVGGISRRIEGEEREELKESLSTLDLPEGMGVIGRTAGLGRHIEELQWDLGVLLSQWNAICDAKKTKKLPFLIYEESNIIIRAIRDYLRPDIQEILVDDQKTYEQVQKHIEMVRPDFAKRIKYYNETIPLFSRFQIETQIQSAFQRGVTLPSGGAIVIDQTEALISIDINSAKATSGRDIEQTALETNLEATSEIARQLRLRDLGGLIVIDYIDMLKISNRRTIEKTLLKESEIDRAKVRIGQISKFGLLEMSRQRLRPHLGESSRITCPRCGGTGHIPGIEALTLMILRVIEEEALKENTAAVQAELPVKIATYLINEKRTAIIGIENRHCVNIILLPNPTLKTPHYHVERIRIDEANLTDSSYKMATQSADEKYTFVSMEKTAQVASKQTPAVQFTTPEVAAPNQQQLAKPGLVKRIFSTLFSEKEVKSDPKPVKSARTAKPESKSNKPTAKTKATATRAKKPKAKTQSTSKQPATKQSESAPNAKQRPARVNQRSKKTEAPVKKKPATAAKKPKTEPKAKKAQPKKSTPKKADLEIEIPIASKPNLPKTDAPAALPKADLPKVEKNIETITDEDRYRQNLETIRKTQPKVTPIENAPKQTHLPESDKARYIENLKQNRHHQGTTEGH